MDEKKRPKGAWPPETERVERWVSEPFRVVHKKTGKELWVSEETESGFVHKVPLYPQIGFIGPPAYILKKPAWERAC